MRARPVALSAVLLLAVGLLLTGCSPTVAVNAAADSNNPLCANVVIDGEQDSPQGLPLDQTNAQGTIAWGNPARVLLTCGVAVPKVSPLPCVEAKGIYWLRNDAHAPNYIFTSYGREPAISVAVQQTRSISPGLVLIALSDTVADTKPNGLKCESIQDSIDDGASATPSPSPSP